MPNYTQRVANTFIKGLVTEAGELTFPENASVDELNCELFRDGSRRRRKGIQFEAGAVGSTFSVIETSMVHTGEWRNVGNEANKDYLVIQIGASLFFYNKSNFPYSGQEVTGSIDLTLYQISGAQAAFARCEFTSILGFLVVVSSAIEPIYIDKDLNVVQITPKIRDFEWLGDRTTYETLLATASVSQARKYDTANTGWSGTLGAAALTTYTTAKSGYPPLTHPWYSGKDSSGNFSVAEWEKIYSGSSVIGNGRYILNLFSRNRSSVSGITGLTTETETTRFKAVTSFSSRVFFGGLTNSKNAGSVYFTQILTDIKNINNFFQTNDPTAEDISDLLDTDGGVIVIPGASNIIKLYAYRNSLFVFAENGVWQIKGVDDVFSPAAYSIGQVSEVGIASASTFTAAEGVPFWWSKHGIHTLSFDQFGTAKEENLTISTVQTFWNQIDNNAKLTAIAEYDRVNKKVFWLYKNNGEEINSKFNKVLILDIMLQAFYPWKFEDTGPSTDYVIGLSFYSGFGNNEVAFNVVSGADNVIDDTNEVVADILAPLANSATSIVFLGRDTSTNQMKMAFTDSNSFVDWGSQSYSSYAETGYDFVGDLTLKKTSPYITMYLRETETGWQGTEETGYTPIQDSSLLVSAYWDFRKEPSSAPQQAYRRKPLVLVDSENLGTYQSNETVVTSRLKVRGKGRSLRIRIESEAGKDFIYLGHGLIADVAGRF